MIDFDLGEVYFVSRQVKIDESRVHRYRLVETYNASNVSKVPLGDKINAVVEMPDAPWMMHGIRVGSYVSVAVIKELAGLKGVDITRMQGKRVRQYGPNQRDKAGRDVSGKFIMNDIASAILFEHQKHACQWIQNPRQVNIDVAPNLLWVESGHANVSYLFQQNYITILLFILY